MLALLFAACASDPAAPCVCHENFVRLDVEVTEATGDPAVGATHKTVRTSDGLELRPSATLEERPGFYPLIDDSEHAAIDGPTMITFTATGATGTATLEGIASLDGCGCHVQFDGIRAVRLMDP